MRWDLSKTSGVHERRGICCDESEGDGAKGYAQRERKRGRSAHPYTRIKPASVRLPPPTKSPTQPSYTLSLLKMRTICSRSPHPVLLSFQKMRIGLAYAYVDDLADDDGKFSWLHTSSMFWRDGTLHNQAGMRRLRTIAVSKEP